MPPQPSTADITQALSFADELTDPSVFAFLDVEAALADAKVVRRLKEFALEEPVGQTIVLTPPISPMPAELDGVALPWTLEPPDVLEVAALVRHVTDELVERGLGVTLDDGGIAALIEAVRGVSLPEAERLILREAMAGGGWTPMTWRTSGRRRRSCSPTTACSSWCRPTRGGSLPWAAWKH